VAGPILLFDVMDTLVHDPFYAEVLDFFSMTRDELFAIKDKQAWVRFECGETDEATLAAEYFTDRRPLDLDGLKATMRDAYRWIDGTQALLADLRSAGHEIHALSNYPTWWEMIEERLGLSAYLEWSFVSCQTGVRKPDPRAYLGPAQRLGVHPEDCIFIDDRAKNCRAAEAVGMPSILFESGPQLRTALNERGLV
jgi:HAD superfamily hydrolase (TIGR01509 family)